MYCLPKILLCKAKFMYLNYDTDIFQEKFHTEFIEIFIKIDEN